MNSIYLKPSGRIYYASFVLLFILISTLLNAASAFLAFNIYQVMFILLALASFASLIAFLYFQHKYIHVEDEIITVREGIITSKISVIPFNKINEIKTQFSFFDRLLGVGTIMIDTAGTSAVEVVFKNVPKESISAFLGLFRQHRESAQPAEEAERDT